MARALLKGSPMSTMLKRTGCLAFLASVCLAPVAYGFALDTSGTVGKAKPPPKVAPKTACDLVAFAAWANPSDESTDAYRFSGTCNINVAPEGSYPVMQKVKVLIDAEWSPKLKRASESVTILHPDEQLTFSTWATCNGNPFAPSFGAQVPACTSQGYGANKFSYFLNTSDVPFSRGRTTEQGAKIATERTGERTKLREVATLKYLEPSTLNAGQKGTVSIVYGGGANACPMEVSLGDGTVKVVPPPMDATNKTKVGIEHTYAKPGSYSVKAKALPGCSGEATANVTVRGASIDAAKAGETVLLGAPSTFQLTGKNGTCKYKADWGDGKTETGAAEFGDASTVTVSHRYAAAGQKKVTVTGLDGCTANVTATAEVKSSTLKGLTATGKVEDIMTFSVQADGTSCPLRVDWGDGKQEEMPSASFGNGKMTIWHRYDKPGKYLANVRGLDGSCLGIAGAYATN